MHNIYIYIYIYICTLWPGLRLGAPPLDVRRQRRRLLGGVPGGANDNTSNSNGNHSNSYDNSNGHSHSHSHNSNRGAQARPLLVCYGQSPY